MELIPHDELKPSQNFNFAPMIDFLFLMLALFATLAISKATLFDQKVELVENSTPSEPKKSTKEPNEHHLHVSIREDGSYIWLTEFGEYPMKDVKAIQDELMHQYQLGVLPKEKDQTQILLHVDKKAPWESVLGFILGTSEIGFQARPVYTSPHQEISKNESKSK